MKTRAPTPKAATRAGNPVAAAAPAPAPLAPSINLLSLPIHAARRGVATASQPLPHLERVQSAFGHHDITGVQSTVNTAPASLDANAYTIGDRVAFSRSPDIHLAAHESAHVVQQRAGIAPDASHEHHADRVADTVARGHSAESLLDRVVPNAAPAPVVQFDRDEDTVTDEAIIAILERNVGKGDTKAANARMRDLTAFLLTLSAGKALALATRISANKRGDKVAHLFHYKLSTNTTNKLVMMLAAQWGIRFVGPTAQATTTPSPPPEPAPTGPDPRWAKDVEFYRGEIERSKLAIKGTPTPDEIDRLVDRLERDELTFDAELLHLVRLDPKVAEGETDRPWVRLLVATRLETFLENYRYFATALPVLKRARAYLDAHSRENVEFTDRLTDKVTTGIMGTVAYAAAPVLVVDGKVEIRRGDIDAKKLERDIVLNLVIQPLLGLAKLGAAIKNAIKAGAGYLIGVPWGALLALRDLGHAAVSNVTEAMSFMHSLTTGKFLKKVYELCKQIYELLSNLPDMIGALGAAFAAEWNSSGPFGKGKLVGQIVGYIAMSIAIGALTEGGTLAETTSTLNRWAFNVLRITEKAANPFTYLKPFMKPLGRAAKAIPGMEKALVTGGRVLAVTSKATEPARRFIRNAVGERAPRWIARTLRRAGKNVDNAAETTEALAPRWEDAFWRKRDMPSMATIEAAEKVGATVTPKIAGVTHDLTPMKVMVGDDGQIWLRMCSKDCGPLLAKLRATDDALAKAGAADDVRAKVDGIARRTNKLQEDWPDLDDATREARLDELSNELEALGKSDPAIGKAIAEGDVAALASAQQATAAAPAATGGPTAATVAPIKKPRPYRWSERRKEMGRPVSSLTLEEELVARAFTAEDRAVLQRWGKALDSVRSRRSTTWAKFLDDLKPGFGGTAYDKFRYRVFDEMIDDILDAPAADRAARLEEYLGTMPDSASVGSLNSKYRVRRWKGTDVQEIEGMPKQLDDPEGLLKEPKTSTPRRRFSDGRMDVKNQELRGGPEDGIYASEDKASGSYSLAQATDVSTLADSAGGLEIKGVRLKGYVYVCEDLDNAKTIAGSLTRNNLSSKIHVVFLEEGGPRWLR